MTTKILFVDDEPDICEIATLSLDLDPDFEVRTCSSGAQALDEAARWQPDLILLDVMMPDMDGPTTLNRLRAQAGTSEIPVIFVTARTQARDVARFRKLGAIDVIAKPFDPMTLADTVREMAGR